MPKDLARIMHELLATTGDIVVFLPSDGTRQGGLGCKGVTPRRDRGNTQAQPAARQAGKEVKRERMNICRTACISRLSRVSRPERSEVMRFAPQTTLPPAPAVSAGAEEVRASWERHVIRA